jgi:hypothetical protein
MDGELKTDEFSERSRNEALVPDAALFALCVGEADGT